MMTTFRIFVLGLCFFAALLQTQGQNDVSTESKIDGKRAIIGRLKKDHTRQLLETRVNARLSYKQANDRPTQQQRFYSNIKNFKRPNLIPQQFSGKNGAELQSAAWDGSFNITNLDVGSTVYAMAVGTNDEVVICTDFVNDVGDYTSNIARWDGQRWTLLGGGTSGFVNAIAIVGGNIYVGGEFSSIGGISARNLARWDGQRWNTVGQGTTNGTDAPVNALLSLGSTLYVGGNFAQAGTLSNANGIAALNVQTQTWSALRASTASGVDGAVYALAANGSNLVIGGDFIKAGTLDANNIAQWNVGNATWQTIGTGANAGTDGIVYALAATPSNIFVGGDFRKVGTRDAENIARWSISSQLWLSMGSGTDDVVRAIVPEGSNNCMIAGDFSMCGSTEVNYIASWNGSTWQSYRNRGTVNTGVADVGVDAPVYCLAQSRNGNFFLGGDFFLYNEQQDISGSYIGVWNSSIGFSTLGGGLTYGIYAIALSGSDIYVGGDFSAIGGVKANNIARWDGRRWNTVGTGTDGAVYALAVNGTSLYAGGEFSRAGAVNTSNIARWNISTSVWSAMGNGLDSVVWAIIPFEAGCVAGGEFMRSGTSTALNRVALWNGSLWSSLGSGTNNGVSAPVYALTSTSALGIIVGGAFTQAGTVSAPGSIAAWRNNAWTAVGAGVDSLVYALTASGSTVYAGGNFARLTDNTPAQRIIRWNGIRWEQMGAGFDGDVYTISANTVNVFVGGAFTRSGTRQVLNTAFWRTTAWVPLDGGTNEAVWSIVGTGGDAILGGSFVNVGSGLSSLYFGRWRSALTSVAQGTTQNVAQADAMNIYPNPAHDIVSIDLPALVSSGSLRVVNMQGHTVHEIPFFAAQRLTLNTTGWAKGAYVVQVHSFNGWEIFKSIIVN